MARTIHISTTVAVHLVINGYGHWLSNDPRGSGSAELKKQELRELGPLHFGRKRKHPSKQELREFYHKAEELLEFDTLWFNERARLVIAAALEAVAKQFGYTIWACAVLRNHVHLVVRVHRDRGDVMWEYFAVAARDALRRAGLVPSNHPVWSNRPYVVFKTTVPLVYQAVGYVEDNPEKHGLPRQEYPWVQKYEGWPHRKGR
jgi:REP element-mobilizing transposase RayT